MKYVCDKCGVQLPVDRDVDEDAVFSQYLDRHRRECANAFENEARFETSQSRATGTGGWK